MLDRIYKAHHAMDAACTKLGRPINIMEICGTHTVAIFRNGIKSTLPDGLRMISGPGCPVCVTDQSYIDNLLKISARKECLIATYGDMIRVRGRGGSLETMQMHGNVRIVLSSSEAVQLARDNPDKEVVFVAVGFETTAPASAVAVGQAVNEGLKNFSILSGHKLVLPAMHALLSGKNNNIDAFLCPGHVSVIIGYGAFDEIAEIYKKPCVVAGFEPMQIIQGLGELCHLLAEGKYEVRCVYSAVVTKEGNTKAQEIIRQYFEPADGYWRGLGKIEKSSLKLKEEFSEFDAYKKFNIDEKPAEELTGCHCGEVLCGLIEPPQCSLFGTGCTPESPVGPCMVSSEGTCAAWFKYTRRRGNKK